MKRSIIIRHNTDRDGRKIFNWLVPECVLVLVVISITLGFG